MDDLRLHSNIRLKELQLYQDDIRVSTKERRSRLNRYPLLAGLQPGTARTIGLH